MPCEDCWHEDHDLTRRRFLSASLGASLGLALSGRALLAQEGATQAGAVPGAGKAKRCVVLWMAGGMTQTDTFDPKPGHANAGPLKAIKTAAKGLELSEYLPRLAEQARSVSLIRSMATREGAHERARYLVHTGYAPSGTVDHPDVGSQLAVSLEDSKLDLPAYVSINGGAIGPGFLGVDYAPYVIGDPTRPVADLAYPAGVDAERFDRRRRLLEAIEKTFKRDHPGDETRGHTSVYAKADRMMHSPQLEAFDLSSEAAALRDAYGRNRFGQGCLMARRLLQRGVKTVQVQLGGWDTHQDNFTRVAALSAQLDAGFATLIADLRDKGLLDSTLILCLTEFGRTPRINQNDGRDHWANGWSVALAGGGVRGGRVVGATGEGGLKVAARPVTAADLRATIFHTLGVDLQGERWTAAGRPIRAVPEGGGVVRELFEA